MRFVFDLSLCESGAAVDAPVDWLFTTVDESLFDERTERTDDGSLIAEIHGEIRGRPCTEDSEPLEIFPHDTNIFFRIQATLTTKIGHAHPVLLGAELAVYPEFDWKAVTVPARHIRRVESGRILR